MNSPSITLREMLGRVRPEDKSLPEASAAALVQRQAGEGQQHVPWFVRTLTAFSAWIAAIMLLVFIFGVKIVSSAGGSILLGVVIIAAAVFIHRKQEKKLFLEQLALALSLAGQVLVIGGLGEEMRHGGGALAAIVVSVCLIFLYPDRTHRFLSTLVAIGGAVSLIYEMHIAYGHQVLCAGIAAAAVHLWFHEAQLLSGEKENLMRPVAYGIIAGFLFMLIPSMVPQELHSGLGMGRTWIPMTVMLICLLLMIEYRLFSFHGMTGINKPVITVFAGTVALAAACLNAPGIIGALLVLVIGFHRGNRLIKGLAIAFLAVFLTAYYYNMQITLLTKSYALLASGGMLLLLRPLLVNALASTDSEVTNE
jgi:uncharacterized membrane protein